jgi:E3 ubiquitin-protein ligase RBX1
MADNNTAAAAAPDVEHTQYVEVKKWSVVAMWRWDVQVENCAICRNQINDLCVECQANSAPDTEDCNVAWGSCNHAFHHHCISRWLKTKAICPMCSTDWELTNVAGNR